MRFLSKKILISGIVVISLLILIIGGALGYTYYQAITGQSKVVLPDFTLEPASQIKLGDLITAKTLVKCPWGHHPEKAELTVPEGLQIVTEPEIREIKTQWGKTVWEIIAEIQPFRTGKIKQSDFSVAIISEKDGKTTSETLTGKIPGFAVLAVDTGKEHKLDVATTVKEVSIAENNPWILLIIALLALAGTIIFLRLWLIKRKKIMESLIIPPWEVALSLLHELKDALKNNKVKGQICISRLTDIVRDYLEHRFNIHAPSQTTHEFLTDLDKSDSPLELEHKQFLRDFMTAADMVKFAKLPADQALLENAINKAEQLVKSTTPDDNGDKGT
jgi:hypothetical protein